MRQTGCRYEAKRHFIRRYGDEVADCFAYRRLRKMFIEHARDDAKNIKTQYNTVRISMHKSKGSLHARVRKDAQA